jgi:hypothetical protein
MEQMWENGSPCHGQDSTGFMPHRGGMDW